VCADEQVVEYGLDRRDELALFRRLQHVQQADDIEFEILRELARPPDELRTQWEAELPYWKVYPDT